MQLLYFIELHTDILHCGFQKPPSNSYCNELVQGANPAKEGTPLFFFFDNIFVFSLIHFTVLARALCACAGNSIKSSSFQVKQVIL